MGTLRLKRGVSYMMLFILLLGILLSYLAGHLCYRYEVTRDGQFLFMAICTFIGGCYLIIGVIGMVVWLN